MHVPRLPSRLAWYWQLVVLLPTWILPTSASLLLTPHSIFFHHAAVTPLTQLVLNLEELRHQTKLTAAATRQLHLIDQSLLSAQYLKSLLLAENSQPAHFGVSSAIQEVVLRQQNPLQGKFLLANVEVSKQLQLVGPAYYFQEMMTCVINNAFEAYAHSERYKFVTLNVYQNSRWLKMSICDQGQGMHWLTQKLVTKPGFSSKKSGHGVGLAFVQQIIEKKFKGKLIISSYPGMGTVVMISIPTKSHAAKI